MSWIETVEPEEASGRLSRIYEQVASPSGQVDEVLKVHSLRPRTLRAHLSLYKAALHSSPNGLTPAERELVGVVVSRLNGCRYCVKHHRAALARVLDDAEQAREFSAAALGETSDDEVLSRRQRALCAYAIALTEAPDGMVEEDLEPLRAVGLDDADILDLNQIVAYFAYVNRTVLGLGVGPGGEKLGLHPGNEDASLTHR